MGIYKYNERSIVLNGTYSSHSCLFTNGIYKLMRTMRKKKDCYNDQRTGISTTSVWSGSITSGSTTYLE